MNKNPRTPKLDYLWLDAKMKKCNWSVKDGKLLYEFPSWLLKRVYSQVNMVMYHGRYIKGRLVYPYIPKEFTIDNIPIILDVQIDLNPPDDAILMSYPQLKQIFRNNKYED